MGVMEAEDVAPEHKRAVEVGDLRCRSPMRVPGAISAADAARGVV
jgi:hypothetical protein